MIKPSPTWRLCKTLSIKQAALLLADIDPTGPTNPEQDLPQDKAAHFAAAKQAISAALLANEIEGTLHPVFKYDSFGMKSGVEDNSVDTNQSQIVVSSLQTWLSQHGVSNGFFFPDGFDGPAYLNPAHPRYAPKLAAAVMAWSAADDSGNKTPKQRILKWLSDNAGQFGFIDETGAPLESVLDDLAKIANWQTNGGAPRTPG